MDSLQRDKPRSSRGTERGALQEALLALLDEGQVSWTPADRLAYSRDLWPRTLIAVRDGRPSIAPPDLIVWPESSAQVCAVVKLAQRFQVPVIPYGGGSGVCGGTLALDGGLIVDLKRMSRVHAVAAVDHLADVDAGIIGQTLEEQLNLYGVTLGHFPSSIYCSTLGGWIATRSSGQTSTLYGNIEDMVEAIEFVDGQGNLCRCSARARPNLARVLCGAEGTLGIITRAQMRVRPLAEHRLFRAYRFSRLSAGCEAIRRIIQRGLRPAVVRLYDELDTLLAKLPSSDGSSRDTTGNGGSIMRLLTGMALEHARTTNRVAERLTRVFGGNCLLVLCFEGAERILVESEVGLAHAEALATGGVDLGEEPACHWYAKRYAVSYKMSPVFAAGAIVDTLEVAATWSRLLAVYEAVRKALARQAVVLAHFSHAYQTGCSIYFTFATAGETAEQSERLYDSLWRQALNAAIESGATFSHHHGVGCSKAAFMLREHGLFLKLYDRLRVNLDPDRLLNPGKLADSG